MSSIIPEDIKTVEEARKWLHKRGWGLSLAEEELAKWEAPAIIEDIEEEEVESEIGAEIEAEELTWDDEDEDDDEEDWDDDEEDDDEDEEDK